MNTKLLYRLAWKELRTLRAFWLTLLGAAVVFQGLASWMVGNFWAPQQINFLVPIWIPVMFSLACASVAFAGEREDGTDQLLSRLAVSPLTLWSVKLAINVFGTVLLVALLFPMAWAMGCLFLGGRWQVLSLVWHKRGPVEWMSLLALLWQVNFLAWGMFLSLLCRRVLTCVVLATVATALTPLVVSLILDLLGFEAVRYAPFEMMIRLVLIPSVLLLASAWLVQTWDENRWPRWIERLLGRWHRLTANRVGPVDSATTTVQLNGGWRAIVRPIGLCWQDEWLPAWRREVRRLLWLEWRQARRVMLFVGVAFGLYVAAQVTVVSGQRMFRDEVPCLLFVVAFAFGVWSFHAQQREQQFREFTRHGVSATSLWLTKQTVWWLAMFVTAVTIMAATAWLQRNRQSSGYELQFAWLWEDESGIQERRWNEPDGWWRAFVQIAGRLSLGIRTIHSFKEAYWSDGLLRAFMPASGEYFATAALALTLSFAVGQFVSLLISRAVTATTVGFLLACVAFGWQQLMVELRVPAWLALLPLVVALLLASYLRMSDWLEERNTLRSWLKVGAGLLVVSLGTFIGVPWYRVAEVPRVSRDDQSSLDAAIIAKPSPAAKGIARRWLHAAESLEEEPVFLLPVREQDGAVIDSRVSARGRELPLSQFNTLEWTDWKTLVNRDWVARHAELLAEVEQISREPACAFEDLFSNDAEKVRAEFVFTRFRRLAVLLKMASQAAMSDGRLDDAARYAVALLRFGRHQQQHQPMRGLYHGREIEVHAFELLLNWARHPGQTSESLHAALGHSHDKPVHPVAELYLPVPLPRQPLTDALFREYVIAQNALASEWQEQPGLISWAKWERLRQQRVLDYSAAQTLNELRQWSNELATNGLGTIPLMTSRTPPSLSGRVALLRRTTTTTRFEIADNWWELYSEGNPFAAVEARRRALLLTIAVRAFALDRGHLPAQFDDLIGEYLNQLPADPWSGLPFEYRPEGYPFSVNRGRVIFPPQTPLFFSGGSSRGRMARLMIREQGHTDTRFEWAWTGSIHGTGSIIRADRSQPWPGNNHARDDEFLGFPLTATEREGEAPAEPGRE